MKERMTTLIADDNSSVTVEFLPASGATGKLILNADQLLVVVKALGEVRAKMVFGKPMPRLEGQPIATVFSTRWYIRREPLPEGSAICFYHPAFGPVGFLVPNEQVKEMVRLLSAHIELAQEEAGQKLN